MNRFGTTQMETYGGGIHRSLMLHLDRVMTLGIGISERQTVICIGGILMIQSPLQRRRRVIDSQNPLVIIGAPVADCASRFMLFRSDHMGYKTRGAKIQAAFIKGGSEIRIVANREGLRYISEVCDGLLKEDYNPHKPPHSHIEPALNTAEVGSVPIEIFLNPNI
jgi:hypothetical protein